MNKPEKIVLASGNKKKISELQGLLKSFSVEVIPQSALNVADVEETGLTFIENAILKARNAAEISGLPALADDSGLEVDFLKGAPGIYSARFAGEPCSDANNNSLLLEKLQNKTILDRIARYQCVLAFMRHGKDPTPLICHASWDGYILESPLGDGGFGYDPLFFVPSHQCSAAQLSAEEKAKISHRGKAMKLLQQAFVSMYG